MFVSASRKKNSIRTGLTRFFVLVAVVAGTMLAAPALTARADILIMPIRVVFDGRQRNADLLVLNDGEKEATFRMSWLYQTQTPAGNYTERPENAPANPYDVGKMIVFSPRQMTLPPGGRQRVRLSLRKPADLPDGEYHAHLRLQRLAAQNDPRRITAPNAAQTALSINIGFGIPVIIRQGRGAASVTITNPHFVPASADGKRAPSIVLTLNRSGVFGSLGAIKVYFQPKGSSEVLVGQASNVNVFTEVTHRDVPVKLTTGHIANGILRIVYEGDGPDKGITFDEKTFPVGG